MFIFILSTALDALCKYTAVEVIFELQIFSMYYDISIN